MFEADETVVFQDDTFVSKLVIKFIKGNQADFLEVDVEIRACYPSVTTALATSECHQ